MGFMHSYKRLDNLCRDMNSIGVTGYIEDMECTPNGINLVPGWKNDYLKLKHYRHIRNQIAHDNDADENNMCSYEDVNWIENFYHRIMVQSDPLALYRKATLLRTASKPTTVEAPPKPPYIPSYNNTGESMHKPQYIPASNVSEPMHKPQYIPASNVSEPMHKPQYIPANNAGRRKRKFLKYGIMILLTIVIPTILLLVVCFAWLKTLLF